MNTRTFFHIAFALLATLVAVGCGQAVEVPVAHVGKVSTASGLQQGIIQPSRFRLDACMSNCDALILVEASDHGIKEVMQVFMPRDTLNLTVEVRGTVSISADEKNVEKIFKRMPAQEGKDTGDQIRTIKMNAVYATYGEPIIREAVRSAITKYSIVEVTANRERISQELLVLVKERLKSTPLDLREFGLADLQPPKVIVDAQEAAATREIAIQQAEADKQVRLKQAEGNLAVALKQQEVDLKVAETQVLVDKKLASGVSSAFIAQRSLVVLEQMAKSPNKVFIVPNDVFRNPALLMGITQRALEDNDKDGGK